MRLRKQISRKIKDTEYAKFVIVIPPEDIKKIGWKEGEELTTEIMGDRLIIKKK